MAPLASGSAPPVRRRSSTSSLSVQQLGAPSFREDHNVRMAYVTGAMVRGIASTTLVARMARAGLLSFVGTGGWSLDETEQAIQTLQADLPPDAPYGFNLLSTPDDPEMEASVVELYLRYGVRQIEASAFMQVSRPLVWYRLRGARRTRDGMHVPNRVMAKVSRPEVARQFVSPPPQRHVDALVEQGRLSPDEAALASEIPMADDVTVEADSGGHTDNGVASSLFPAMLRVRDRAVKTHGYDRPIRVGAAGGLGTPEAIASAFILGADYVVTGSINQSTVEAGTSDAVKDLLEQAEPQDTAMAPAGDMFELGAQVQVLSKGVFFPARANKLYRLYTTYDALSEIPKKTRRQIQDKFFHRSFEDVYAETRRYYAEKNPDELEAMERDPKHKMAKLFRWYFAYSNRIAIEGVVDDRVNFQISCGPALGSFNLWAAGSDLAHWRNRHIDDLAERLMDGACRVLENRIQALQM
jgi:trans-AT polyketide synthase/acyltransferase/oxidoreductase domain-containing protein